MELHPLYFISFQGSTRVPRGTEIKLEKKRNEKNQQYRYKIDITEEKREKRFLPVRQNPKQGTTESFTE